MKLHLNNDGTDLLISGYGKGEVKVREEVLTRSCIVTPRRLVRDWAPQAFSELEAEHFQTVLDLGPEIILLGSGSRQQFPAGPILERVSRQGIGMEVMDTGATCRTYNILAAEGRRVAAALLMIR